MRTASALAKKRSALLKKKGRAGCLWAPSAASACWTPTPVSREGAGLCFPCGRPVAAENELGWAPRGSRFLVLRASHSLIEARVHAGPFGCHILAEFTVPPALRDRNILLRSTAVTPERKGSTRAPVLRRGGRTDRGLAPGVDRVKSAGVMQIHRPLPLSFR